MSEMTRYFRKIRESDLEKIMEWRMRPEITKYMYTDPKLTIEDQRKWFEKISNDPNSFYWISEMNGVPVGLTCLTGWDRENSIIHTGGYWAEKEGQTLENIRDSIMSPYDFAFHTLGVNKAAFDIMDNNPSQIRWMKRMGATQEGILRKAIKKNGEYHDLYLFSYLKEEWMAIAAKSRFRKIPFEY